MNVINEENRRLIIKHLFVLISSESSCLYEKTKVPPKNLKRSSLSTASAIVDRL